MATRRKNFKPKDGPPPSPQQLYSDFMGSLLAGSVRANKLYDTRDAGALKLDYEDPNG